MDAIQRAIFENQAGYTVDALRYGIRFLAILLLFLVALYIMAGVIQQIKASEGFVNIREVGGRIMRLSLIIALGMTVILS